MGPDRRGPLAWGVRRTKDADPKDAVRAYQAAAEKGDAQAIYGMLSKRSQVSMRAADVARIVADEKSELAAQAKGLGDSGIGGSSQCAGSLPRRRGRHARARGRWLSSEHGLRVAFGAHHARSARRASPCPRTPELRRAHEDLFACHPQRDRERSRSLVDGLSRPEGLEVQVARMTPRRCRSRAGTS